jgi:hypothetical protein
MANASTPDTPVPSTISQTMRRCGVPFPAGAAAQESEYVAAEVDDHRDERGQVQEDLEREVGTAAEETVRDGQMAVRGHGKELGQPLDDAEHERLQDGHARPP